MNETMQQWLATITGATAQTLLGVVVVLAVGIIAIHFIEKLIAKALEKSHLEKAAHSLIQSIAKVTMYALLALSVAARLGIDITGLVALASVLTLSISLALQNILSNVISGFMLLNTRPFHSGDFIEVGGLSGTVTDITMSYTKLTTPDNKQVSIPNAQMAGSQIVNYTACGSRRVDLTVSAAYTAPTQKVLEALLLAAQVDNVLLDPAPFAAVDKYGDSAVSYILRVWTKSENYWDVYFQVNQHIKEVFDSQGVEMTFPHLNVHLDK